MLLFLYKGIRLAIRAVKCDRCGELYMYDDKQDNVCPRCGSSQRTYIR